MFYIKYIICKFIKNNDYELIKIYENLRAKVVCQFLKLT